MLETFLADINDIRDTLSKEGDHNFFGKTFSFFSAEPILFYNNEKDVIVYANSMFSNEFNFTVEDLAEWKYSIYPLLNKDDQEPFREAMHQLLNGDGSNLLPDTSYRLINKGKKYSYYRVKIRKLHESYYYIQLENSLKSAVPVLKNKTADELINNAESILKFGFWLWDFYTGKLYWTKGMYQLLEYNIDEETTPPVSPEFYSSHIIKTDVYLDFEKRLQNGNIKDSYRNKYQLKTNRDNVLTVFEHANIEYDDKGKIKLITGLTRDVTIQEESMKSLADFKEMMNENETFLNYGTWESDPEGNKTTWSDGMYNIFGYEEADKKNLTINSEFYKLHMYPGDSSGGIENNFDPGAEKDNYLWDFQVNDHKGITKILSSYCKIIRNNEQKIEKIIGATRDVTQIRQHEVSLENMVSELNRSNRELEEFAYVASHDLQEPLRKISTFSQRLQARFAPVLDIDGNLYINRIIDSCQYMRNLIDNLIEFSRINTDNPPVERVDLPQIVNKSLEDLDLLIAQTKATIEVGHLPVIEAIRSQMGQLFVNIINNSIKFRMETVPLQIKIDSRKVTSKEKSEWLLQKELMYHLITIEDNGIGFEQQYADRIFHLFQRLEGKSEYPGTGIGLSICKKIVTHHKGIIFASGEPQKGATLTIILPEIQ